MEERETTDPILVLVSGRRKFKFWLGVDKFCCRSRGNLYLQVNRDQEIVPEVGNLQSKSWSPNSLLALVGIPVRPLGLDPFYFPPQDAPQDSALTKYATFCCLSRSQFISAPLPFLNDLLTYGCGSLRTPEFPTPFLNYIPSCHKGSVPDYKPH